MQLIRNQPSRILVELPVTLGQALVLFQALEAVRALAPGAIVTAFGEQDWRDASEPVDQFDRVVLPPADGPRRVTEFLRVLRERYDYAILASKRPRIRWLRWWLKSARVIAMDSLLSTGGGHVVDGMPGSRSQMKAVWMPVRGKWDYDAVDARVSRIRHETRMLCPYIVIDACTKPGSEAAAPCELLGRAACHLGQRSELPALVAWRGRRGRVRAECIASSSGGQAVVAPPTTLGELAGLARHAELVVSTDPQFLDLANAWGTPGIDPLFDPADPTRRSDASSERIATWCSELVFVGRQRETRSAA